MILDSPFPDSEPFSLEVLTQKSCYSRIEFVVHSVLAETRQESDHSLLEIAGTATRNRSTWARMRYVGRGDELKGSRLTVAPLFKHSQGLYSNVCDRINPSPMRVK